MADDRHGTGSDVGPGRAGHSRVLLTHPAGGTAELYAHGAQLLRWRHPRHGEVLFLSRRDDRRQESHGGVPVVFPRFGRDPEGKLKQHGFARDMEWTIGERSIDREGRAIAAMSLCATPETLARWPHDFRLELEVALGDTLTMTLRATNPGPEPFAFTAALHTYLRVAELRRAEIRGLGGVAWRERAGGGDREGADDEPLVIDREIDRTYRESPSPIVISDAARELHVENRGWRNVVVWNPGPSGDERYDFAPGEWAQFVCIEGATVLDPIALGPGERWSASQTLSVRGG